MGNEHLDFLVLLLESSSHEASDNVGGPQGPRSKVPSGAGTREGKDRHTAATEHAVHRPLALVEQSHTAQADAHRCNGYKHSQRTVHVADREVDKSLTRNSAANSEETQKSIAAYLPRPLSAVFWRWRQEKGLGSSPFALKSACPESWQIVGKWVFEQETGKQKK